jgi:hypothetical protein
MPKPNPLSQGLSQQTTARASVAAPTVSTPSSERPRQAQPPSRSGRVLIGGHFAPEVQTALKIIAAEERTTMQALLAEAINTVFAKRHKPEIADISTS